MNKILQLNLASALMATTAFSTIPTQHTLTNGMAIGNGTTLILPANHQLVNAGTNNGLSNGTYDADNSTVIDVLVGGSLIASSNDQSDQANATPGGTIGTNGANDDNGITVRHHESNWVAKNNADHVYGINCNRGFISNAINFGKEAYLQEMYDTSKLARIYSNYSGNDKIGIHGPDDNGEVYRDTILLSQESQGTLGSGEKTLSANLLFPNNSGNSSIIPGQTFVIPATSSNATISANLSNSSNDFTENFSTYATSPKLQILPVANSTLTLTGNNDNFSGQITIGDNSTTGGTIAFGDSNADANAGSTTHALGGYTNMSVGNNSTVSLAGSDTVSIDKLWTFYGAAKLQATGRITLTSGGIMTFGENP